MNWKGLIRLSTGILSLLCFTIVGVMYSKLNFIDTPYLVGAVLFLLPTLFLRK